MKRTVFLTLAEAEYQHLSLSHSTLLLRSSQRPTYPYTCIYSGETLYFTTEQNEEKLLGKAESGWVHYFHFSECTGLAEIFERYADKMPYTAEQLAKYCQYAYHSLIEVCNFEPYSQREITSIPPPSSNCA